MYLHSQFFKFRRSQKKNFSFSLALALFFSFITLGCSTKTPHSGKTAELPKPILRSTSSETTCSAQTPQTQSLIKFDFQKGEITSFCDQALFQIDEKLKTIVQIPTQERTFENSFLAYENAYTDFYLQYLQLSFPAAVSPNADLRAEANLCQDKVGKFFAEVSSRKPLYLALKDLRPPGPIEKKMHEDVLRTFKHAGMQLSDDKIQKIRQLSEKLTELENKFEENLTNNTDTLIFTKEELAGVPESALERFQKIQDGKYIVTTKGPDYIAVADNARSSETRRRNLLAYENKASQENTKLFHEILSLRREMANTLGYRTWADIRLEDKMAKTLPAVQTFLADLRLKLKSAQQADQRRLLAFKKQIEPSATEIYAWDTRYLANQIKIKDYQIDGEKISEYFPADQVVQGMFKVYSELLGIEIFEVVGATTWHPTVKLYQIRNKNSCPPLAHFYMDNIPRPGKRGGAAAYSLVFGRKLSNGYVAPVSAVVANFNAPTANKPSLLSHDQVETLFHEFGHIMHQTLTKVPYGTISGTSVAWDFVEAPSQMLEHWVWDLGVLRELSGHYTDTSKKIPTALVRKMIAAKDFNQANLYTRQLLLASFDMALHTSTDFIDINTTYKQMFKDFTGINALEGSHFPATFSHIVGGYNAGYYGYLWSEVFADDMHSKFASAPKKLMDPIVGKSYRENILERGGTEEPQVLLKRFLGREPRTDAFLKKFKK